MPSSFTTYQEVQIQESCDFANSRVWISDLNGDGHIDCEEEILQVMPARPLSRFTPSKVPQTFGFAALDHAAKLHCVNPFGMPHDLAETADLPSLPYRDSDPFTYNDKEYEDRVTKMYDYHARWYDAALGRWGVVDPLASEFSSWTPYHYVHDNPLNMIDPDGRSGVSIHKDSEGNIIAEIDDGDNNVYVHNDLGGSGQHIDGVIGRLKQKRDHFGTGGGGEVDKIASITNKIYKFFEEGDQQQHSGENWFIYGKGSASGWTIKAPKPDPEGANRSIDISNIFPLGGGVNGLGAGILNPIRGLDGFHDKFNSAVDEIAAPTQNDTIYNCDGCNQSFRDSSGVKIKTASNRNQPQKTIKTHY